MLIRYLGNEFSACDLIVHNEVKIRGKFLYVSVVGLLKPTCISIGLQYFNAKQNREPYIFRQHW